jgi:ubiquinone/menaquinone biosynthesis C-methylase UbiE
MTQSPIQQYYTDNVLGEWRRLVQDPYHRLELDTTLHYLEQHLPPVLPQNSPPHGLILDAGGGPGRYTVELARRGYDVVLLDFTPANLDFARRRVARLGLKRRVRDFVQGSIVDLSQFADGTFDAVICTGGPLSHVMEAADREQAISELARVAKAGTPASPGAPLFVSVMSRLSVLVVVLQISQTELGLPHFRQLLETGDYFGGYGFTACHFFLPEELGELFTRPDLDILEMVGLEGLASRQRKEVAQAAKNPLRWQSWLAAHHATCTHPAVVGISEHMLIICRKK